MKKDTGNKIRKIRELKNVSQHHVAKHLGISQAAYSCIESGKTKLNDEKLSKISNALAVPKDLIMNFDVDVALNACLKTQPSAPSWKNKRNPFQNPS